ncbi:hypothetical protein MC378_13460 [Polaribacter sp. MSW13]|uniref:Uncharacterized protein n=1 Tax=Polaribacter marinus TaxID=2916838 RepID=A0A9X1VQ23_9FLAO|nr:hypothetical protein [Polaribacter marinus]MCI2230180.1 hypothetical protein [Polaribacter marinus]
MKYTTTTSGIERGILTSTYKEEIKRDIRIAKRKSLSRIKSLVLNHQGKLESQTGTILQVSLFVIAIIVISF